MIIGETSFSSWISLSQSTASVAATLLGFVAVALSVNLKIILEVPRLITRAAEVLVRQLATLTISLLMLVPDQWFNYRAICILMLSVVFWLVTTILDWRATPSTDVVALHRTSIYLLMGQVVSLSLVVGAIGTMMGHPNAPIWMTIGVLASFILALGGAWVLLVEIIR